MLQLNGVFADVKLLSSPVPLVDANSMAGQQLHADSIGDAAGYEYQSSMSEFSAWRKRSL